MRRAQSYGTNGATIGAYLKQQLGYGHAEGLLFRKYPNRRDRVYGDSDRLPGGSADREFIMASSDAVIPDGYPTLRRASRCQWRRSCR